MSELQAKVWPLMVQRTMGSGGSWAKWIHTWIRNIFIDHRKWRCIRLTYLHSVSFGYPSYPPGFVKFPFASDSLIPSFTHVPGVEKARFFKKYKLSKDGNMVIFSRHLITIQQAYETTPLTENRISNDKSKLEQCTCYCLQKKFNLCINASHSCSCHKGLSLCPPWCFESRTM